MASGLAVKSIDRLADRLKEKAVKIGNEFENQLKEAVERDSKVATIGFPYLAGLTFGIADRIVYAGYPILSGLFSAEYVTLTILTSRFKKSREYQMKFHDPIEEEKNKNTVRNATLSVIAGVSTIYAPEIYAAGLKISEMIQQYI